MADKRSNPEILELTFPAATRYIQVAAKFGANAGALFCPKEADPPTIQKFLSTLELVVSEACTNAVKHTSSSETGEVSISISLDEKRMIIEVKDNNAPFDFEAVAEPDLDNHPVSGYGIFLMRSFMDKVSYSREGGQNCITMIKEKPDWKIKTE